VPRHALVLNPHVLAGLKRRVPTRVALEEIENRRRPVRHDREDALVRQREAEFRADRLAQLVGDGQFDFAFLAWQIGVLQRLTATFNSRSTVKSFTAVRRSRPSISATATLKLGKCSCPTSNPMSLYPSRTSAIR